MFSNISASIVEILQSAGISAGRAYPSEPLDRDGGCFVRAAVESVCQSDGGFARFLGMSAGDDGEYREVYGMRCDISLALDIYASPKAENPAELCEEAVDELILALGNSDGLSIKEFNCGRARPDKDTGMFLCACRASMSVLLTVQIQEEAARFSDFILKGEIKK